MKRIREKLNSTGGASVIFALLVAMLCILAGASALTAAAANSGRYTHIEQDQQQYLSVASAVELLRDELGAYKIEFTRRLEKTPNETYALADTACVWYDGDGNIHGEPFLLKTLVEELCREIFEEKIVPADWYDKASDGYRGGLTDDIATRKLTITGGSDDLKALDKVWADVTLDMNTYDLTVVLGAGDDHDQLAYRTTMQMQAKASSVESYESDADNTVTTLTFNIEWPGDNALVIQG